MGLLNRLNICLAVYHQPLAWPAQIFVGKKKQAMARPPSPVHLQGGGAERTKKSFPLV